MSIFTCSQEGIAKGFILIISMYSQIYKKQLPKASECMFNAMFCNSLNFLFLKNKNELVK